MQQLATVMSMCDFLHANEYRTYTHIGKRQYERCFWPLAAACEQSRRETAIIGNIYTESITGYVSRQTSNASAIPPLPECMPSGQQCLNLQSCHRVQLLLLRTNSVKTQCAMCRPAALSCFHTQRLHLHVIQHKIVLYCFLQACARMHVQVLYCAAFSILAAAQTAYSQSLMHPNTTRRAAD